MSHKASLSALQFRHRGAMEMLRNVNDNGKIDICVADETDGIAIYVGFRRDASVVLHMRLPRNVTPHLSSSRRFGDACKAARLPFQHDVVL
jgi:hypothetical protein